LASGAAGGEGGGETTLMMRDDLPEEYDPELTRLSRRLFWGAFILGIVSILVYMLLRGTP
jgi:hypothetical protein